MKNSLLRSIFYLALFASAILIIYHYPQQVGDLIEEIPWFIFKYWYAIVFGIIIQSLADYFIAKGKLEKELEKIQGSVDKRALNENNEIMLRSVYLPDSVSKEVHDREHSIIWFIMAIVFTLLYVFCGWSWWWGSILWIILAFSNGAWSHSEIDLKTGRIDDPEYAGFGFGFTNMPVFPKFIRNRRYRKYNTGLNGDMANRIFLDFFIMVVLTFHYYHTSKLGVLGSIIETMTRMLE